jgi:hypothetical protein
MRALLVVGAAVLLAAGGVAGWFGARETESTETITETTTATETTTEEAAGTGLPDAVEVTRLALLAAARSGDYEALRPLIPADGFEYTFGDGVAGGPVAYWQELERTTNERPLETLAALLEMPYVLTRGLYVWPWAYIITSESDLSVHERELLAPVRGLNETIVEGTGYLGWRTGIEPNGDWTFYVAGD